MNLIDFQLNQLLVKKVADQHNIFSLLLNGQWMG